MTDQLSEHTLTIPLVDTTLVLDPLKAMYWPEHDAVLIADTHLGKSAHFSNHGIRIPSRVEQNNFDRLFLLLKKYMPKSCFILGDLFHSIENESCARFKRFMDAYPDISWKLILGNHDILDLNFYQSMGLEVHEHYLIGRFIFSHHPLSDIPNEYYNLHGHIHPGIVLKGLGKQRLRLPCFFFAQNQGILPAFGAFTGLHAIEHKKHDRVYVIADASVIKVY